MLKPTIMKKIIVHCILIFGLSNSFGQSPFYDITDLDHQAPYEPNSYIKDTHGYLNLFEGTYIGSQTDNGNTYTVKLVLQKKELNYDYDRFEDLLIGEYEVQKNGSVVYSSLNKLQINYPNQNSHSFSSNSVFIGKWRCHQCGPNELHINGGLVESVSESSSIVLIRLIQINNQPGIEFELVWRMRGHVEGDPPLPLPSFPGGTYLMVKQ
ncbi:MAG: hypothetical protein CFE24_03940 [Flavobacterium sp. BFFFF2]|nr:MAG: hypothetical protein CFE24_03940 [Flavobacterium sp. BFFFF2]